MNIQYKNGQISDGKTSKDGSSMISADKNVYAEEA